MSQTHPFDPDRLSDLHAATVGGLDDLLDVEAGLREALVADRHTATGRDLGLDVEGGLQAIVGPGDQSGRPRPPEPKEGNAAARTGSLRSPTGIRSHVARLLTSLDDVNRFAVRVHPALEAFALVLDFARIRDSALDINLSLSAELEQSRDSARALARALADDLDRENYAAFARGSRFRDREYSRATDRHQALTLARALDRHRDHAIALAISGEHDGALALGVACDIDRARARADALALDLDRIYRHEHYDRDTESRGYRAGSFYDGGSFEDDYAFKHALALTCAFPVPINRYTLHLVGLLRRALDQDLGRDFERDPWPGLDRLDPFYLDLRDRDRRERLDLDVPDRGALDRDSEALDRARHDFTTADLRTADLLWVGPHGISLTGVRWSDDTRWPDMPDSARQALRWSKQIGDGLYEVRDKP
jgi:hypothetical protein